MTRLVFDTLFGPLTYNDVTYVDHVELEDADPELVRVAAHAHSAGAILVSEGLDLSHVEPDEVSLEKLAEAMGEWIEPVREPETGAVLEPGRWSGPWYEGHAVQQEVDAEHRARERKKRQTETQTIGAADVAPLEGVGSSA